MTMMFLWVFYRAKEDGAVMLVSAHIRLSPWELNALPLLQGLIHPWDAHGGHGHGHDEHDDEDEEGDDEE